MKNLFVFYIILMLLFSAVTKAEMKFNSLKVRNGIELYEVVTIYKDSLGYIWIGNSKGLSRFDGQQIKTYPIPGELRSFVSDIKEVNNKSILICSRSGLYVFKKNKGNFQPVIQYNKPVEPYSVEFSAVKDTYYIGTNSFFDVFNLSEKHIHRFVLLRDGIQLGVRKVLRISDEQIWIASTNGLYLYNSDSKSIKLVSSSKIGYINDIRIFKDIILVGTENGLYHFDIDTHSETEIADLKNRIISNIAIEQGWNAYIGINGFGIVKYDIHKQQITDYITHKVDDPESLPSNSIFCLLYDSDKILWAGTNSSGVSYSHHFESKFKTLKYDNNLALQNQPARSVCLYGEIKLIGTRDGLIIVEKSGKPYIYAAGTTNDDLRSNIILNILPYPNKAGKFLVGTYGGGVSVFDLNTRKFSPFILQEPFLYSKVYGMVVDHSGFVWITTFNGLFKCDVNGSRPFLSKEINGNAALMNNRFWSLNVDKSGNLWTCTDRGLAVYDVKNQEFVNKKLFNFNLKERVLYVQEDSKKQLWVCTLEGGLYIYNNSYKLIKHLTKENGLPDNNVVSVVEDNFGNYWIATMNGFARYSGNELHSYSKSDGIPDNIFLPASCTKDMNGTLWFGTESGMMYFNPATLQLNHKVPVTAISEITINNTEIEPELKDNKRNLYHPIVIKGAENSLKINAVALNYYNSEDNKIKYILKGYDKHWRNIDATSSIEYKNLPEGDYLLIAISSNNDGIWSVISAELPVKVIYYIYQTYIFYLILIVLFAGLAYWIFNYFFSKAAEKFKNQILSSLPGKQKRESSRPKITEDQSKEILDLLKRHMDKNKPYLDGDLKFSKVSESIKINQSDISQVLTQSEGLNFADFVNGYRVRELIERVSSGDSTNLKITAIAYECGFYSKASLYRAFKKATGLTPGEYFKEFEKI